MIVRSSRRPGRPITALSAACALTLVVTAGPAAATTGRSTVRLANVGEGGLETPQLRPGTFTRYAAGDTLGPWRVTEGDVDLMGSGFWQVAEGQQSLDLEGGTAGAIEQSFPTSIGQCYAVYYALAGNPDSGPAVKTGYARITHGDGDTSTASRQQSFAFDTTRRSRTRMGYVRKTFHFRAMGSSATLRFASTTGSGYGPVIDDVAVTTAGIADC